MLSWVLELENKLSQFSKLKGTTYKKWASGGFLKNKFLNFVKDFLCIYWDNHMAFIFQFVNVVYYIDWFVDIEESLHPWDKAHLVMVYDLFNVLLDSDC